MTWKIFHLWTWKKRGRMATTQDLKSKFEQNAAKAGAKPAPNTTAGKKDVFEKAIKDAAPKDPKPKVRS